jgi:hypothetical protein
MVENLMTVWNLACVCVGAFTIGSWVVRGLLKILPPYEEMDNE